MRFPRALEHHPHNSVSFPGLDPEFGKEAPISRTIFQSNGIGET